MAWPLTMASLLVAGMAPQPGLAQGQLLRVTGTTIEMVDADGVQHTGHGLVGMTLSMGEGDAALRLRVRSVIDDVVPGVLLHEIEARDAAGQWANVCEPDREQRRLALFIEGYDRPDGRQVRAPGRVSLTCSAGVQGKCLRAGYVPWDDSRGPGTGHVLFQTCTRMFRADYCGDGIGWTRNGMPIDLFDVHGIQKPATSTASATMPFEAAWGPEGALCVHHTRVRERGNLAALLAQCPRLAAMPMGAACTEAAAQNLPGALLFNRSVGTVD